MITVTDQGILRSIVAESGRQGDFFLRRGDERLASFWLDLESLASDCRSRGISLCIVRATGSGLGDNRDLKEFLPTPNIKAGE